MLITLAMLLVGLTVSDASASTFPDDATHDRAFKKEKSKKKSKEERSEEQEKADAEEARKRKAKLARVVVLKWEGTSADYTNDTIIRNVRSRISRPDAMFFPEVDVYQNGRKVKDRTVIPAMQPARVEDSNIPIVIQAANQALAIPWNGMDYTQWGLRAHNLRDTAELIWFVDRVELREPLFLLYVAIGYAAENSSNPSPPFFEGIGKGAVNYYWYLAAMLALQEPALMSKVSNSDISASIGYYLTQLQQGAYPSFKLDYEFEDRFDPGVFNKNYEVLINGLPTVVDNNAQMPGYLGRTDVYLKRKDSGHSLSERLEVVKLDEKIYFIREHARKRMGVDFIDQLFLHKNECIAEVDGDILNYLAIYQKMHPQAEVYIAVPEKGIPNRVWIWRYVPDAAHLRMVAGAGDGFPVRFAFVFSPGVMFNGGAANVDDDVSDENTISPTGGAVENRFDKTLQNAYIPFNFEWRAHYNRLMVDIGVEFGLNTAKDSNWMERYYIPRHQNAEDPKIRPTAVDCKRTDYDKYGGIMYSLEDKGIDPCENREQFHMTHWNRYTYLGLGIVMGRDAGIGFGPRVSWRNGWTNLPHAWQSTLHFGWAIQPPIGDFGKRFRPLVDADLRGGISMGLRNSIQREIAREEANEAVVMPVFGLSLGLGFTF
jgi:hypothetical protein